MTARYETLLWLAQRISAAVLALCVTVHLATIILAVRGGLSAAEILIRTQNNVMWMLFYILFVFAVAIHAPIGLRAIARETLGWRGPGLEAATGAAALGLAWAGWRAVAGLVLTWA